MNEPNWLMVPMSKYTARNQDQEALVSEYGPGNKEVEPGHVSPENEHVELRNEEADNGEPGNIESPVPSLLSA